MPMDGRHESSGTKRWAQEAGALFTVTVSPCRWGGVCDTGGRMDVLQDSSLTLKIRQHETKYAWSLHRSGVVEPIKFSVPIFSTEAAAAAAGMEVLTRVNARAK